MQICIRYGRIIRIRKSRTSYFPSFWMMPNPRKSFGNPGRYHRNGYLRGRYCREKAVIHPRPGCLYNLLSLLIQTEEFSMPVLLEKYPRLIDCYKFHIDSWVLNKYYPVTATARRLSDPTSRHLLFNDRGTRFSTFSMTRQKFAYELYRCTSDPDFVKYYISPTTFLPKDYSKRILPSPTAKLSKRNRPDHRRARSGLKRRLRGL